jgi:periplasmic protein TonB
MARRDYANSQLAAERRERRRKSRLSLGTLQWSLLVSVLFHVALLALRIVDPERFNKIFQDTPLEVILVNAKTDERVANAQAIAQAALAGGGEADAGRATSPLPPSATIEVGESLEDARKKVEQLQEQQQQLLAQIRREMALLPPPDPAREAGTPEERAQEERRKQLLRLLASIEKRINEENARPKKRYISPATREAEYAIYYDSLRRRIEDRGTRDFPEINGKKLYGELTMNITIDADGRVIEADIVRPSNSRILDRRAIAIVRAAGPFGRFSTDMRKQADQIVVTSRFRFTRDEGLETTQVQAVRQ